MDMGDWGNRERWIRRNVKEEIMDMGNGVQFKETQVVCEMRKGNVRVKRFEEVKIKRGGSKRSNSEWSRRTKYMEGMGTTTDSNRNDVTCKK